MVLCLSVTAAFPLSIDAKQKTKKQAVDIYDLSIDDNIAMPELEKQS